MFFNFEFNQRDNVFIFYVRRPLLSYTGSYFVFINDSIMIDQINILFIDLRNLFPWPKGKKKRSKHDNGYLIYSKLLENQA